AVGEDVSADGLLGSAFAPAEPVAIRPLDAIWLRGRPDDEQFAEPPTGDVLDSARLARTVLGSHDVSPLVQCALWSGRAVVLSDRSARIVYTPVSAAA